MRRRRSIASLSPMWQPGAEQESVGYTITPPSRTICAARAISRRCGCEGTISKYCAIAPHPRPTAGPHLPVAPDRPPVCRELRQRAEIDLALAGPVEIRPARCEQPEFARERGELDVLLGRMT